MRFALVLFLAIFSIGVRPAKAQQLPLIVTGRLELSNGSPGGYVVEVYMEKRLVNTDKTNPDGSYTISSKPDFGFAPNLLSLSRVICRQDGKFAHSLLNVQTTDSAYKAYVPRLKLLSTTEAKYSPKEATETIQVVVHVEATLYRAGKGSFEIKSSGVADAVRVLGKIPQAKRRAIVDSLKFDNLPSDVVDEFLKYRR